MTVYPSMTAIDHLEGMYACWCSGMPEYELFSCIYRMMKLRGMAHDECAIQEMKYYIDQFECSQSPADPAFCYECHKVIKWITDSINARLSHE